MKTPALIIFFCLVISSCQSQPVGKPTDRQVGGRCEGCEAIYEYGDRTLNPVDTLPGFNQYEPRLKVTGTVYQSEGRTPASNVILYIYHTNRKGIYETSGDEQGWATRHGFIRGWVKTGADGQYTFYTFRPAAYPNEQAPEHIHITVKEEGVTEYYVDEIMFTDDPLLTAGAGRAHPGRGGSGIVKPEMENGILTVKRDIVLGLHIPDY